MNLFQVNNNFKVIFDTINKIRQVQQRTTTDVPPNTVKSVDCYTRITAKATEIEIIVLKIINIEKQDLKK